MAFWSRTRLPSIARRRDVRGWCRADAARAGRARSGIGRRPSPFHCAVEERIQAFLAAIRWRHPSLRMAMVRPGRLSPGHVRRPGAPIAAGYREVLLPWYWGDIIAAHRSLEPATPPAAGEPVHAIPRLRVTEMRRRPEARAAA